MFKTFEAACQFVIDSKIVTVFGSKNSPHPSLWDNTDLSEDRPKAGGWSPKVKAVWDWKTRIPQTYPDSVFYGKIPGGDAALIEMEYFRSEHYPAAFQSVDALDGLCNDVFKMVRAEPNFTGPLRKRAISEFGCTKSRFDTAMKKLQISLNIVRSNDVQFQNDFWLPMSEVHLDVVQRYS